jgi:hypothetical protein
MGKYERMSISDFLHGRPEEPISKLERHLKKYGIVYKIIGTTIIIFVAGGGFDYAFAATDSIEVGAQKLYAKLLSVGKWVIIFKGGFDTIKNMAGGDFDAAKKGFLSYIIVYIFLFGLPWAMDEIDKIFVGLQEG